MSWGRIDDDFWEHPKTLHLLEFDRGVEATGVFWLVNAYCNRQRRGWVTLREVAMLTNKSPEDVSVLCELLTRHPETHERGFLLPKQTRSNDEANAKQTTIYEVNSFDEYRSKSEARASAGSEGGRKSGETRRSKREANAKQTRSNDEASRSNDEANAKQTRSKREPPDPGSRLPIPDPRSPIPSLQTAEAETRSTDGKIRTTADLEAALSDAHLAFQLRDGEIRKLHAITTGGAIEPHEWKPAAEAAVRAKADRPAAYALKCVAENRAKAAEDATHGPGPGPTKPKRESGVCKRGFTPDPE